MLAVLEHQEEKVVAETVSLWMQLIMLVGVVMVDLGAQQQQLAHQAHIIMEEPIAHQTAVLAVLAGWL